MLVDGQSRATVRFAVNWWRCASIAAAIAVWFVVAFAALMITYPSASSATRFLAYVIIFNLLPGVVFARLLVPRVQAPGIFVIYALAAGVTANVLIFLPLWAGGYPQLFRAFPIVAFAGAVIVRRRLRLAEIFNEWAPGRTDIWWTAGALFLCLTPLLTMVYLLADDPGGSTSLHFAFQGVVVRSLETGWPPANLGVADLPLSYHYAAHLWILAAFQNSGIDLGVLVARYGPLFLPGCAAAMVFAFGRFVLRLAPWAAALPVVAVFWIVGIPTIFGRIFASFAPYGSALILSPALGFVVYLLTLTVIIEARSRGRFAPGAAVVAALTFIGTGARGVFGPILICALALLAIVDWWRTRAVNCDRVIYVLSATVGCVAALIFFFTLGSDVSGTGFVRISGEPFTFLTQRQSLLNLHLLLMALGVAQPFAAAIGFLVIATCQAGFLTAGFWYDLVRMWRGAATDADILLIGTSIAGVVAFFLTEAPGHSHLSFLQYASIAMALLGARGLDCALKSVFEEARFTTGKLARIVVISTTGVLLIVQLSELPSQLWSGLDHQGRAAVTHIFATKDQTQRRDPGLLSCSDDRDAVDLLAQVPVKAVVVNVPSTAFALRACEYFWPLVDQPRHSINPFALRHAPEQLKGPLQARFAQRLDHLTAAVDGAIRGAVSAYDLIAIARTVSRDEPVFVLLAKSVHVDENPQILRVAEAGPLVLLRVLTPVDH